MLPIEIQMQIDLSAQAHKREIEAGFAAARKRLEPKPRPPTEAELLMRALSNALPYMQTQSAMALQTLNPFLAYSQADLQPCPFSLFGGLLTSPSADPASTARSC